MEGCSHGELDEIYEQILVNEKETSERVDLVLLCGDVQVRYIILLRLFVTIPTCTAWPCQ